MLFEFFHYYRGQQAGEFPSAADKICPTKIAKTAEQTNKDGVLNRSLYRSVPRLRRSICGKAPLFRPSSKPSCGYASESAPEPLRSTKSCPTKPVKTVEHVSEFLGFTVLALVLLLTSAVDGQASSTDRLIDQFGRIQCDDFLARIDNFYMQINASPNSRGYYVIQGERSSDYRKLSYEILFESATLQRGYDRRQAVVVRGPEKGPFEISMWLIPKGDDPPDFGETKWDLRMSSADKPFELRSDMAQICSPEPVGKVAHDLFDENPDGSIYVIVHGPTVRKRSIELRNAEKMVEDFDPRRVRYLLRRSDYPYSDYYFAVGRPRRSAFKSYF